MRERDKAALVGVEREAKKRGKFADGFFSAPGIGGNQRGDGVQGIEEEVGMNAGFERGEAGLGEQFVGALLLDLAGAQFEGCELELVAHGFELGDG